MTIEQRVTSECRKIGVPAHIMGYHYVRDAIMMVIKDLDFLKHVTKEIYPTIAKEAGTISSNVERAIRHAIDVAWTHGNLEYQNEVFGYSIAVNRDRPTNSQFIATIADKVKLDTIEANLIEINNLDFNALTTRDVELLCMRYNVHAICEGGKIVKFEYDE